MNQNLLVTLEILLVVVLPLLALYLRGNWPLRATVPCLLSIPVLWYFTYAPLHELSHAAGAYLAGGRVVSMKLIPRFWMGEFGGAWITPEGLTRSWQQLTMTGAPYVLDLPCVVIGLLLLRRAYSSNPFTVGLTFMLLCLRPAFDFVCEPIAFLRGDKGDFYALQGVTGGFLVWLFIVISFALCLFSVLTILRRFVGFPETRVPSQTQGQDLASPGEGR